MIAISSLSVLRGAGCAALLVLAACADGTGPDPAPTEATPADPAPVATNQPAPGTATAATGAGPLRLGICGDQTDARIHFTIADAALAVPAAIILDAVPAGLAPPITEERVVAELKARTAQGHGCPGKPLAAGLLLLQDKLDNPLLDGSVALLSLPPGGITRKFAALTTRLQSKPGTNCHPVGADLIGCTGTERRGGTETQVMYVITTDTSQKMNSGGPLAARCVLANGEVDGCNLVDELPGGIAVDAGLKRGTYSTASLRAAMDIVVTRVDALRL